METTAYEHTTETRSGPPPIKPNATYVKSCNGQLKLAEIVLCILILICASIDYWFYLGGGWVLFVAGTALITTIILWILHCLNVFPRLSGRQKVYVFIYYCVYVVLFVIAAIVAAVRAHYTAAIGATTFFTFGAIVVYAIDGYFMYRVWRTRQIPVAVATTTSTTATVSNYETKGQY